MKLADINGTVPCRDPAKPLPCALLARGAPTPEGGQNGAVDGHGTGAQPGTPAEEPWVAPPVRADALVATWAMLLAGHVLAVVLTTWALTMPGTTRMAARVATILALLVLGGCGAAMAAYGLRVTLALRRPQNGAAPPPGPAPLALAWLLVLASVGVAVIALVGWGTAGVLPAVAGEFVFVPLAMRTRQYAEDVAGGPEQPPATRWAE